MHGDSRDLPLMESRLISPINKLPLIPVLAPAVGRSIARRGSTTAVMCVCVGGGGGGRRKKGEEKNE